MTRTDYTGETGAPEAASESDKACAEHHLRLQDQREAAMHMATENTIDSEQNETG